MLLSERLYRPDYLLCQLQMAGGRKGEAGLESLSLHRQLLMQGINQGRNIFGMRWVGVYDQGKKRFDVEVDPGNWRFFFQKGVIRVLA